MRPTYRPATRPVQLVNKAEAPALQAGRRVNESETFDTTNLSAWFKMPSDRFGLTNRQAHPEMWKKTLNRRIASSNKSLNDEESRNISRGPNALQLRLPTDSTAEDLRQLQRTNDRRSQYNEFPSADGNSYVNNNMDVSSQRNGPLWSGQDGLWDNTNCAGMHNHEFATTNNAETFDDSMFTYGGVGVGLLPRNSDNKDHRNFHMDDFNSQTDRGKAPVKSQRGTSNVMWVNGSKIAPNIAQFWDNSEASTKGYTVLGPAINLMFIVYQSSTTGCHGAPGQRLPQLLVPGCSSRG